MKTLVKHLVLMSALGMISTIAFANRYNEIPSGNSKNIVPATTYKKSFVAAVCTSIANRSDEAIPRISTKESIVSKSEALQICAEPDKAALLARSAMRGCDWGWFSPSLTDDVVNGLGAECQTWSCGSLLDRVNEIKQSGNEVLAAIDARDLLGWCSVYYREPSRK